MAVKPMTAKQRYWLEHITAADASDGTLSEYAAEQDLSLKSLYGWKTRLIRHGFYSPERPSGFASIKTVDLTSGVPMPPAEQPRCRVTLPSGARVEFMGSLSPATIRSILTQAGRAR